jgi:four helix bundle protein
VTSDQRFAVSGRSNIAGFAAYLRRGSQGDSLYRLPVTSGRRKSHKDLILWQKGMTLAAAIYRLAHTLPKHEVYGLASQIRRASVSIPSNVAEGAARHTTREFLSFLYIARGSCAELETQLTLMIELGYVTESGVAPVLDRCDEVGRLLNAVITSLRRRIADGSALTANR